MKLNKTTISNLIVISFLLAYIFILPTGVLGLALTVSALFIMMSTINKRTNAVYLLLMGPSVFGAIFRYFEIASIGSVSSVITGFVILALYKPRWPLLKIKWRLPVLWLVTTFLTLFIFYFYGPQTEYSQNKLTLFLLNIFIVIAALRLIVGDKSINLSQLGFLGIISSIVYLSAISKSFGELSFGGFFRTASLRINADYAELTVATNAIAILAATGIAILIGDLADKKTSFVSNWLNLSILLIGFLLLNMVGQRLFILSPIICIFSLLVCHPINRKLILSIFATSVVIIVIVITYGLQTNNPYILSMFIKQATTAEALNRSINWESAIDLIQDSPVFGHGLGGYYVAGYSMPGDGTYAHNLILELLTETGLVGTAIISVPMILFLIYYNRELFITRVASGATIIPLWILDFIHAMVSHDLTKSSALFATTAVIWGYLAAMHSKKA